MGLLQGPRLMAWTTKSPILENHWVPWGCMAHLGSVKYIFDKNLKNQQLCLMKSLTCTNQFRLGCQKNSKHWVFDLNIKNVWFKDIWTLNFRIWSDLIWFGLIFQYLEYLECILILASLMCTYFSCLQTKSPEKQNKKIREEKRRHL